MHPGHTDRYVRQQVAAAALPRLSTAGLLACLMALLAGCESDTEGGFLSGTWIGQVDFTVPGDLIVPSSITLVTSEYLTRVGTGQFTGTGDVTGTITFEAAGQSVCGPVTGNHEYPDFSLSFALDGKELTGRYAGRVTFDNCTSKFGRRGWCRMEGTFSTDDGAVSEALTLTLDPSRHAPISEIGRPVCE